MRLDDVNKPPIVQTGVAAKDPPESLVSTSVKGVTPSSEAEVLPDKEQSAQGQRLAKIIQLAMDEQNRRKRAKGKLPEQLSAENKAKLIARYKQVEGFMAPDKRGGTLDLYCTGLDETRESS